MARKNTPLLVAIAVAVVAAGTFGVVRSRPPGVDVARPTRRVVVSAIAVSGRLRGEVETSVGAQTGGRVAEVPVREGDRVRAGQVVARLDDEVLRAQAGQAQVGVETARAQLAQADGALRTALLQAESADDAVATARALLAQASRPPLPSDVARLDAETRQAVAVAQARLAGARQRLAELREGPTREEREQAQAQADQARASLEQAERDRERQRQLLRDGAVSRASLDTAETAATVARRTYENAAARLRQVQTGTRAELLAQAQAEVAAAEATVVGAKASGAAQMRTLRATPRPEDVLVARRRLDEASRAREIARGRVGEARQGVAVAQARLAEAERALLVAGRRVGDAVVRAPFDGTIAQVLTEAGGVTGPNAPLVRLVRTARPEIRIDLDEVNLGKVRVGQEAKVTCDAFPGETLEARVRQIGAQVDADRGTVEVRLTPLRTPAWLRPGQTLSVNIVTDPGTERLVVPLTAVQTVGGASSLLVVDKGVVVRRDVTVGAPGPDGFPVVEGLSESDLVVVDPTGKRVGQTAAPKVVSGGKG